jgi:squalene-hopene/tetraprenyl-beta-curcumene cyclase
MAEGLAGEAAGISVVDADGAGSPRAPRAAGRDVRAALQAAIVRARDALLALQHPDGYWCFELEADCTIPAEYILLMHYMDEVDPALQAKLAVYLRRHQADHGGWPLYYGGDFDMSCTVKAYYALRLAGDDPAAPHMARAREAVLARGGAARANVFTLITLALFAQVPRRAVPFIPVEIMLLPRWFPFHLSKVSYWSRTVMVPLFVLCSLGARAKNPTGIGVRELFTTPPEEERHYLRGRSPMNRLFLALDKVGRTLEPFIPGGLRRRAVARAEEWFVQRLNGTGGLGAIFPAMVNAYEALALLGYPPDHPHRATARRALEELLVVREGEAYCQPCNSVIWDTGLASLAVQEEAGGASPAAVHRALDWLAGRQLVDVPGDWQASRPALPGGGWAFQFRNDHYPDLDDTAVVAWAMDQAREKRFAAPVERAADWLCGMQSANGGFAAFDVDNTHYYLNEIPFADHGALLDPPTSDVSARCLTLLTRLRRRGDRAAVDRVVEYLRGEQEADGSWFGRWGTHYVYGTWSVLVALEQAGIDPEEPMVRRAVGWLGSMQRVDGGWGESNDSYYPGQGGSGPESTSFQTAWALLGLMAAGEADSPAVRRGVDYLLQTQGPDGLWHEEWFTAPGFPRVFYLKYHGYDKYFPLWALARYRNLTAAG